MVATGFPTEAYFQASDFRSYAPNANLASYKNCFVKLVDDYTVDVAGSSDIGHGVLYNAPSNVSGAVSQTAMVQVGGRALIKAGTGGLAANDLVGIGAGGVGVAVEDSEENDGEKVYGQVVCGADEGALAAVELFRGPVWISHPAEA